MCITLPLILLTHVELSNEARHVVVLEELWQNLFGEATLVKHMETGSALRLKNTITLVW